MSCGYHMSLLFTITDIWHCACLRCSGCSVAGEASGSWHLQSQSSGDGRVAYRLWVHAQSSTGGTPYLGYSSAMWHGLSSQCYHVSTAEVIACQRWRGAELELAVSALLPAERRRFVFVFTLFDDIVHTYASVCICFSSANAIEMIWYVSAFVYRSPYCVLTIPWSLPWDYRVHWKQLASVRCSVNFLHIYWRRCRTNLRFAFRESEHLVVADNAGNISLWNGCADEEWQASLWIIIMIKR